MNLIDVNRGLDLNAENAVLSSLFDYNSMRRDTGGSMLTWKQKKLFFNE